MQKGIVDVARLLESPNIGVFELARKAAREYVYNLREQGKISFSDPEEGHVPSVHVVRRTLPEAWETATMALMGVGQDLRTHYDPGHEKGEYKSFPSLEATVSMHISEPRAEPRFHKHFLGGCNGLGDYRAEMEGIKDHWVLSPEIVGKNIAEGNFDDVRGHTGWLYSYSSRFRNYPFLGINGEFKAINQFNQVVRKLAEDPTTKSAQCITWDPRFDHNDGQLDEGAVFDDYHSPCLQRLWFRLVPFEEGYKLNINSDWRSRDHLKAVPHNVYGLVEGMIEPVRLELEQKLGVPIGLGRYHDKGDSLHLYGHYLDVNTQGKDAEAYLQDVFRIAGGEPIEERLILPGTPIHEMTLENIKAEYDKRMADPDFDRQGKQV